MDTVLDVQEVQQQLDRAARDAKHGPVDIRAGRFLHENAMATDGTTPSMAAFRATNDLTTIPPWADIELSTHLPELASAGERQHVEMKEQFPTTSRDLAKEIAAFATSNAGTILLGITDSGEINGLPACTTQDGRAGLIQRIEGICANVIKPIITPAFRFGVVNNLVVLAIDVPKGEAPLYYVGNIPYLRQITAARPAEPQEVIDHILAWHRARDPNAEPNPQEKFLGQLASLMNDILVDAGELNERQTNPWLDEQRRKLAWSAQRARELAAHTPVDFSDTTESLEALATTLDKIAHERLTLSSGWDEMRVAADEAMNQALEIRRRWIEANKIDEGSIAGLSDAVIMTARKLSGLASRLDEMINQNRLDEIQSEAAKHGLILLKAATFGVGLGDDAHRAELITIGRLLRELETRTIYIDGGQSVQKILDDVREASSTLNDWTNNL